MTDFLKKNKAHIYLLFVIVGLASLPLTKDAVLPEMGMVYKLMVVLVNLVCALIAYGCMWIGYGNAGVAMIGSMLYTLCPMRCDTLYSGVFGEGLAWSFLPLVLLGLVRLYEDSEEKNKSWMTLALGLVLVSVSSLTVFAVMAGATFIWLLLMGKKSLRKPILLSFGKAVLAIGVLGGLFLLPQLLEYRNPEWVGSLIPQNFRMSGCHATQYLSLFSPKSVGAAVLLLVFWFMWGLFVKKYEAPLESKLLIGVGVLLFLGSKLFPWDLLQNKNMLCSVVLAILRTPTSWVIPAYGGMIWIGCGQLAKMAENEEKKIYWGVLALVVLISFGIHQLLLMGW